VPGRQVPGWIVPALASARVRGFAGGWGSRAWAAGPARRPCGVTGRAPPTCALVPLTATTYCQSRASSSSRKVVLSPYLASGGHHLAGAAGGLLQHARNGPGLRHMNG